MPGGQLRMRLINRTHPFLDGVATTDTDFAVPNQALLRNGPAGSRFERALESIWNINEKQITVRYAGQRAHDSWNLEYDGRESVLTFPLPLNFRMPKRRCGLEILLKWVLLGAMLEQCWSTSVTLPQHCFSTRAQVRCASATRCRTALSSASHKARSSALAVFWTV